MDALASVLTALGAGGVITAMVTLVRLAIGAERRRADDWRTAAQNTTAANTVLTANIDKLITSVEQLAKSQQQVLSMLQAMSTERREAA